MAKNLDCFIAKLIAHYTVLTDFITKNVGHPDAVLIEMETAKKTMKDRERANQQRTARPDLDPNVIVWTLANRSLPRGTI